jgi:hypothetical protein
LKCWDQPGHGQREINRDYGYAYPEWSLPSQSDQNPLAWMIQVNGLIIDAHHAPREIQEEAYRLDLIPDIPGDNK